MALLVTCFLSFSPGMNLDEVRFNIFPRPMVADFLVLETEEILVTDEIDELLGRRFGILEGIFVGDVEVVEVFAVVCVDAAGTPGAFEDGDACCRSSWTEDARLWGRFEDEAR